MKQYKIIRGYYLTGLGQESLAYFFKIASDQKDFSEIRTGDVCLTFYQDKETITCLPALIRVDGVITHQNLVNQYLNAEKKDGFPMLPIDKIHEQFNPILFKRVMNMCQELCEEMKEMSEQKSKEGDTNEFYH